jgi:hypothetical protein
VSAQDGDNDVTNPDPGTHSETIYSFINPNGTWTWVIDRYAQPNASEPQLTRVRSHFTLHLHDELMIIACDPT